ncbi:hypothetical protein ASE12_14315 [Aeromicrobium sp. Root236]|nr:hypothetical protein ASE12_14315 [Aeromicrobium sp. Root236]
MSRRSFLVLSAAATAVLASGCATSSDGGSSRSTTMTLAQPGEPNFGAAMQAFAGNSLWEHLVFDYLTELDENHEPQPLVAKSWKQSDDLRTLTLTLRDDVVFHSGRPLTSADVKYSLEQAAIPENLSQLAGVAQSIASMRPTDDHGLVITLKQPSNRLFELFEITPMVDKETYKQAAAGKLVVGTGPFSWVNYRAGNALKLKKNPKYWGGESELTSVTILIIKQSQALIASARSGRTQLTDGLTPLDADTIGSNGKLRVESVGGVQCYVVGLDASTKPFNDIKARQAVAKALDRGRIAKQVYKNSASPTNLWWPKNTPGWDQKTNTTWTYDPDAARAELDALGLVGTSIPVTVNSSDLIALAIFDIVRNNLEAAGLKVKPQILEGAAFVERNVAGKLGTCFVHATGFGSLSPVACASATAHLKPDGGTHFTSPKYLQLIAAAGAADKDHVAAANAALGQYLVDQAFNLPLVMSPPPLVVSKEVEGNVKVSTAFHYLDPQSLAYR